MQLIFCGAIRTLQVAQTAARQQDRMQQNTSKIETLDEALQATFPVRPPTEEELAAEFDRLFPVEV